MGLPDSSPSFPPSAANIPLPVISFNFEPEHGFLKIEIEKQKNYDIFKKGGRLVSCRKVCF